MTGKIMVVDDNAATRRMVRDALLRNGHDVIEAADGQTALELMKTEQPRVVLADLVLPDTDGYQLVGELRRLARGTGVSILAFSGFVSDSDEARISRVGFDDFIAKPIAPSRLVPLIEAHLPVAAPASAQFGRGRRLVVADDDPMQLKLATFRLSRLGFDVEAVPDGRSALDAVRRRAPDVVVSDVMMPHVDGFSLAMAVRQESALRKVPVVLMTSSYVDPADRELARRAGASALVPRTPELSELIDSLRTTLASGQDAPPLDAGALDDLEKEHTRRVFRQLERQVMLNTGLARRCSVLASELAVLASLSESVLTNRNLDAAIEQSLIECFDAGGIARGALYLLDARGRLSARAIGAGSDAAGLATLFGHAQLLDELIRDGRTLYLPSNELPRELARELLAGAQADALLIVPLRGAGQPLGGLLMIARSRELEEDDWRAFGLAIATQVSHVVTLARAYEERELAERRATEHAALAAGIAHEINNPLASVIANLDMALQDIAALAETTRLPPALSEGLEDARTAADRVREIVSDLKIFTRDEDDRHGPVDVERVLDSTVRMAWNELRHRARLVKNYGKVPSVDAHESRLGQVFLNLIVNAAHAIPPGNHEANEIRLSTSVAPTGRVVISIRDTGTGIPPEVRPRLFTPFFTTKPVGVGTGLGLAISHRIITQFGGTITYDTEVGQGTEFHIALPVAGDWSTS